VLDDDTRRQMCEVAILAAEAVDYVGAGTVEFLLGADKSFYFLEMNTRLQVEHPITEMVTGIDLVQAQIRIAGGEKLNLEQSDVRQNGHAIECRIYAEDPANNWAPSPGRIKGYREPGGPWVRVDAGVYAGAEVSLFYDPMVAKLIVWGVDRDEAIRRAQRALLEYRVRGIATNTAFFRQLLADEDFVSGEYHTGFLTPERMASWPAEADLSEVASIAAAIAAFERDNRMKRPTGGDSGSASQWRWSLR